MTPIRELISEVHRRSLWQVLVIYAAAAWVIYQVVLDLYEGIGLPDWVPGTALVLLLVGLPVVLATAFVQEGAPGLGGGDRPALDGLETAADALAGDRRGRDQESATPVGEPSRHPLSWNRAITAGVLAFAALGLAASGFMGMRALGIGPAGTLIAKGVLSERDPIVVAELESPSGDTALSAMIRNALEIDLSQSGTVRVAEDGLVEHLLTRMQRPADTRLTEAVAREVATRGGLKAVLAGEVGVAGGAYLLSARLVAAETGEDLAAFRETARDSTELVDAIDRLSAQIRSKVGESLRSVRASRPLADVTSSSLAAIRKYQEGFRQTNLGHYERGRGLLREAIALDSSFALAHRKLAIELNNDGRKGEALESVRKALAHPERLTELERLRAQGLYADITGDVQLAIRSREALLDLSPTDVTALNNLAVTYADAGDYERAAEWFLRGMEHMDSVAYRTPAIWTGFYIGAAGTLYNLGEDSRADSAIDALEAVAPEHPMLHYARASLAALRGDPDAAARGLDTMLARRPGSPFWQLIHRYGHASLRATAGQVRAADAHLLATQQEAERTGVAGWALDAAARRAVFWAVVMGDTARALDTLAGARRAVEGELGPEDYPYWLVGYAYAAAGRSDSTRVLAARFAEEAPEWRRLTDPEVVPGLEGLVFLMEGRPEDALPLLERALEERACLCYHLHIADALEAMGRPGSAIAALERYLSERSAYRAGMDEDLADPYYRALVLERLAALHERAGNHDSARLYLARFIEQWEDADPELQPRVEAARRALERLSGEGLR